MAFKTEDMFKADNENLNLEIGAIRIERGGLTIDWSPEFENQPWTQQCMFLVVLATYCQYVHNDIHAANCSSAECPIKEEDCDQETLH